METYEVLTKLAEKFNSEKIDIGNISIIKTNNNERITNDITVDYRIKIIYVDNGELIFYQIRLDGKSVYDTSDLDVVIEVVADLFFDMKEFNIGDIIEQYGEYFILVPPPGKIDGKKFMLFNLDDNTLLESHVFNKKELYNNGYVKINKEDYYG